MAIFRQNGFSKEMNNINPGAKLACILFEDLWFEQNTVNKHKTQLVHLGWNSALAVK